MIVLTDGEPTPGLDINHEDAIALAKKCGIKIYTIGIGGEHGGLWHDPLFGIRPMGFRLNKALLEYFARQTGGKFYMAQHPDDLKTIYEEIDRLEKTQREEPIYTQYVELIAPLCMLIVLCLLAELIATTFIWFCL